MLLEKELILKKDCHFKKRGERREERGERIEGERRKGRGGERGEGRVERRKLKVKREKRVGEMRICKDAKLT